MVNREKGEISEVCQEELFDRKASTNLIVKGKLFLWKQRF